MFKRILIILISGIFAFGINELSFAVMCDDHSSSQQLAQAHNEHEYSITETNKEIAPGGTMGVGNKICPVSGEKIDEKTKVTYEYEGKIYNFCCQMCIEEFKKDPKKYIDKVNEELKKESGEETKGEELMQGAESSHHSSPPEGHHN